MFIGEFVFGCIYIYFFKVWEMGVEQFFFYGCELDFLVGGILVGVVGDFYWISFLFDGIDVDSCYFYKFNKYL